MRRWKRVLALPLLVVAFVGAAGDGPAIPEDPELPSQEPAGIDVWYLGHCGYAVRVNDKLLVFDYLSERGTPATNPAAGGLDDGRVDPTDLAGLETYVFATHSHSDHYDPAILEWEGAGDVTYFFGWEAGQNPRHHYLVGPRATAQVDGVEVFTINSHHSGVPEVAYLVHVDGLWIYHNGDYRQDYVPDFSYLATLTDHMDAVFTLSDGNPADQYWAQAVYLKEHFRPSALFPTHFGGNEAGMTPFSQALKAQGYSGLLPVPLHRGDRFRIVPEG